MRGDDPRELGERDRKLVLEALGAELHRELGRAHDIDEHARHEASLLAAGIHERESTWHLSLHPGPVRDLGIALPRTDLLMSQTHSRPGLEIAEPPSLYSPVRASSAFGKLEASGEYEMLERREVVRAGHVHDETVGARIRILADRAWDRGHVPHDAIGIVAPAGIEVRDARSDPRRPLADDEPKARGREHGARVAALARDRSAQPRRERTDIGRSAMAFYRSA